MSSDIDLFSITPGVGVSGLQLGTPPEVVEQRIGEPPAKFQEEVPEGGDVELWEYPDLGLYLSFGSDFGGLMDSIRLQRPDTTLFGEPVAGLKRDQLIRLMAAHGYAPSMEESHTIDGDRLLSIEYDDLSLLFWLDSKSRVGAVQVGLFWTDDEVPLFPDPDWLDS